MTLVAPAVTSAPRSRTALDLLPAGTVAAGIDIGGTKAQGVLLDATGSVLAETTIPTRLGADGVIGSALEVYGALRAAAPSREVASLGVGIPGTVDTGTGRVSNAVNLQLTELELGQSLSEVLAVEVAVQNDANAAALGAHLQLGAPESVALLNLGTGLAVGIVLDGAIHSGAFAAAGEIGHLPLDPDGEMCGCGQRGCLELYISGSGLRRIAQAQGLESAPDLFAAAASGHPQAVLAAAAFIRRVAWAIQLIAVSVDTQLIALTGGVTQLGPALMQPLDAQLRRQAQQSPFLASLRLAERVRLLPADYPVAAAGAAVAGVQAATARTGAPRG